MAARDTSWAMSTGVLTKSTKFGIVYADRANDRLVKQQFASEGAEVVRMTPAAFGTYMATETAKWERVVKEGGIKAE